MVPKANGTIVGQPTDGGIKVAVGKASYLFQFSVCPLAVITKGVEDKVGVVADGCSIHRSKKGFSRCIRIFFDKHNNGLGKRFYLRGEKE